MLGNPYAHTYIIHVTENSFRAYFEFKFVND